MTQLDLFDAPPTPLEQLEQKFRQFIEQNGLPYDLVAINKSHDETAVIFDRERESLHYINVYGGKIKYTYHAPNCGEFGTNFHLQRENVCSC